MEETPRPRLPARAAVVAVAAAIGLLLTAAVASAHAVFEESRPGDGEVLEAAPAEVVVGFDESVTPPAGALRVFDGDGERVDRGDAALSGDDPTRIVAGLEDGLGDGTYVVAWRVISADGHPARGAFTFAVGSESGADPDLLAEILAGEGERAWSAAATVGRGITYAATLLAAGAVAFLAFAARSLSAGRRRPLAQIGAVAALAGLAATLLGVPLQAAIETGVGAETFVRADLLASTLTGSFGLSAAVRMVGLALVAAGLWRGVTAVAALGALAAPASFLLTGHTVTSDVPWVAVPADAAHLGAGAVWFGGLVLLATLLARSAPDEAADVAGVVARFSTVATVAVVVVILGGLGLAWAEVRALRALTDSAYGAVLIAKVLLAAGVVAIGAYNNRRLVPAVVTASERPPVPAGASGDEPPPESDGRSGPWRRLRRTVRWEALGLVLVLLVTGALVYLQPAREAAGVTGAFSTFEDVGDDHELHLVIDPNRAGHNEIHVWVTEAETLRPLQALGGADVQLELTMPEQDVGPITVDPRGAGPGHWLHAGSELAFPGTWEVEVVVRVSEFEEERVTVEVPVNP